MPRIASGLLILLVVSACGGSAPAVEQEGPCASEEVAAVEARDVHTRCASEGGEVSEDDAAYASLMEVLAAHEAGLGSEATVSDADAMALADRVWAYLDRVASRFTDRAPLDRAEDAAEALVRDRSGEEATAAAAAARAALEDLHAQLSGDAPPVRCAEEAEIAAESEAALERCRASTGTAEGP